MMDKQGRNSVRVVRRIEELKALPLVVKADLTEDEVVAVVCLLPVSGGFTSYPCFPLA